MPAQARTQTRDAELSRMPKSSYRCDASGLLDGLPWEVLRRHARQASEEELEEAAQHVLYEPAQPLSFSKMAMLLSPQAFATRHRWRLLAGRAAHKVRRREIELSMPLYLSNWCDNHCLYCGFRRSSALPRKRLGPVQAAQLAKQLYEQGYRSLILSSGEAPKLYDTDDAEEILLLLQPQWQRLWLELPPQSEEQYHKLFRLGATGLIMRQETYDRERYAEVHPKGPKRLYDWRLGAAERALEAGFRQIELGLLLGLAHPGEDLLALVAHARLLLEAYPDAQITLSLRRHQPLQAEYRPTHEIDDDHFEHLLVVARLALPHCGLVMTTQEPQELAHRQLFLGLSHYRLNPNLPGVQADTWKEILLPFNHADPRSRPDIQEGLQQMGYTTHG